MIVQSAGADVPGRQPPGAGPLSRGGKVSDRAHNKECGAAQPDDDADGQHDHRDAQAQAYHHERKAHDEHRYAKEPSFRQSLREHRQVFVQEVPLRAHA